jgi:excisionase family DNA binding protein
MTSDEACKRLSVSPRTLERYVRDGLLKKYRRRIGREVFYKRSEVEDLLRIRPAEDIGQKDNVMLIEEYDLGAGAWQLTLPGGKVIDSSPEGIWQ